MISSDHSEKKRTKLLAIYCAMLAGKCSTFFDKRLTLDTLNQGGRGGRGEVGTPIHGLYGDVLLDMVWLLASLPGTGYIISSQSVPYRV